jgi:flavodoxin
VGYEGSSLAAIKNNTKAAPLRAGLHEISSKTINFGGIMKILVLSYSLTGNNEALAAGVAGELAAEYIKITEPKRRTNGTIIADIIFKKTPKVQPAPEKLEGYDFVLFVGPVWIGQAATPLRAYLEYIKTNALKYAFVSISGGADGPNSKLADELKRRTGAEPAALIDLHIAGLLDIEKPTRKDTMAYRVSEAETEKLASAAVKAMRETI